MRSQQAGWDSGCLVCAAENSADIAATCRYGDVEFSASIWRDNIMATQFHPEKSQMVGLNIFKNFGEL